MVFRPFSTIAPLFCGLDQQCRKEIRLRNDHLDLARSQAQWIRNSSIFVSTNSKV
jgi:hypothetical protein